LITSAIGCVATFEVPVRYEPHRVADLSDVKAKVSIEVVDQRPENERAHIKKAGMAKFVFERSPDEVLDDGLRAGLGANGVEVVDAHSQADVLLRVALTRYYYEVSKPGFDVIKRAILTGRVEVFRGATGAPLAVLPISSTHEEVSSVAASGWPTDALNAVLADAIDQWLIDPRLIDALRGAARE
jgi:hypothetical protein